VSETPTTATDDAAGRTPSAPDVDQPDGGTDAAGRTPSAPDVDQPDGGSDERV
jgi:hypothetical protein